jgi:hypothetical protein
MTKEENDKIREAYHDIFVTEKGKIVLEDLKKTYNMYDTMLESVIDKDVLLLRESQRTVVIGIIRKAENK